MPGEKGPGHGKPFVIDDMPIDDLEGDLAAVTDDQTDPAIELKLEKSAMERASTRIAPLFEEARKRMPSKARNLFLSAHGGFVEWVRVPAAQGAMPKERRVQGLEDIERKIQKIMEELNISHVPAEFIHELGEFSS